MNKDLTDITVVMDRSGSMSSCRSDAEGGINSLIEEQKKLPGQVIFSLVQFDDQYEFVYNGVPLTDVKPVTIIPRGWTALLDAVGRAIAETGERLKKLEADERPGLVVFVIVTDGLENMSKEYTLDRIKQMIEHQQSKYKWQFTYLGANQDAFQVAGNMGIHKSAVSNYDAEEKTAGAFAAASANLGRMRSASAGGQSVRNFYSDEERESLKSDKKS